MLYSSFCAPSILVIFCITLSVLQHKIKMNGKHSLAIGIFSVISLLCDPLSIYAIMISLFLLLTANPNKALKSIGYISVGFLFFALILVSTGTFKAFTDDALLFNMHVYGKYVDADPQRFVKILKIALKGLFITDTIKPNLVQLRCMISNIHFENLLLTGFIYRFSIIAIATMLAFKREYRASALVYLFASALLAIDSITYRAQPFVIVSSYAVAAVITGEFWQKGKKGTITISQRIVSVATCLVIVCMLYRVADARIRHPFLYSYENAFSSLEALSSEINELACGQQNVKLAVYPGSIYPYWFTGMQPVSKYIFMWPWVAEIAMGDVIEELGEKDELAIIIIGKNPVWGKYYPKQYLQPLFEYLEENYLQIVTIKTNLKTSNDIFVSPELAKRCFNM